MFSLAATQRGGALRGVADSLGPDKEARNISRARNISKNSFFAVWSPYFDRGYLRFVQPEIPN